MKRFVFALAVAVVMAPIAWGEPVQAGTDYDLEGTVVCADWLESRLGSDGLVVVDVRPAADYAAGHIRGSVNLPMEVPESAWVTMRDDLLLELPEISGLSKVLGDAGLQRTSAVVLVTSKGEPPHPEANATRVADTLLYAGVKRVAILDGGYPQWVTRGKPVTTEVATVIPRYFQASVDHSIFVDREYVHSRIGRSLIVDARDAAVYSGEVVEPWAEKAGHIPTARSLPAPLIWKSDGTYKSKTELATLAAAALGTPDKNDEIIVYCGVGGYASSWWFALTQILGFKNVKFFDGSAQEWARYYDMVR